MDRLNFNTHFGCSPYQLWPQVLLSLQVHAPSDWGRCKTKSCRATAWEGIYFSFCMSNGRP